MINITYLVNVTFLQKIYGREEMVSIPYNKLSAIIILFPAKNKKNKDNEVINIEWYGWCVLSCVE